MGSPQIVREVFDTKSRFAPKNRASLRLSSPSLPRSLSGALFAPATSDTELIGMAMNVGDALDNPGRHRGQSYDPNEPRIYADMKPLGIGLMVLSACLSVGALVWALTRVLPLLG